MRLFELAAEDREISFSPFVWRVKLALAHKGLDYEIVPVRFLEKEAFAPSGSKTVPVLEDGGRWISQSWDIACYLEDQYDDRPSLFGSDVGRALSRHFVISIDATVSPPVFLSIIADIPNILTEQDAAYFRKSREARMGSTLESTIAKRPRNLKRLAKCLEPFERTFAEQPFICGKRPAYGDYALFGLCQWARLVSPVEILPEQSKVRDWCQRMLDLYDGLAAHAKGFRDIRPQK
jgi:glutathione S-transferase